MLRSRMGGRGLPDGGNRVFEICENNELKFLINTSKQKWLDVSRILGPIVERNGVSAEQIIQGKTYNLRFQEDNGLEISYSPYNQMGRFVISWLRGIANKVAYCIGCKTCMVECPTAAFIIDENRKIHIKEDLCIHCMNCISLSAKGCLGSTLISYHTRRKRYGFERHESVSNFWFKDGISGAFLRAKK